MNEPSRKKTRRKEKYGVQEKNQAEEDMCGKEINHMFPEIYYVLLLFQKIHKINKLTFVVYSMNVYNECNPSSFWTGV